MKQYIVTLELSSPNGTLVDILRALGIQSLDKLETGNQRRLASRPRREQVLKIESQCSSNASLDEHIFSLLKSNEFNTIAGQAEIRSSLSVALVVGVIFDTAMCSVSFASEVLKVLSQYDIDIEVVAYPSTD